MIARSDLNDPNNVFFFFSVEEKSGEKFKDRFYYSIYRLLDYSSYCTRYLKNPGIT